MRHEATIKYKKQKKLNIDFTIVKIIVFENVEETKY